MQVPGTAEMNQPVHLKISLAGAKEGKEVTKKKPTLKKEKKSGCKSQFFAKYLTVVDPPVAKK